MARYTPQEIRQFETELLYFYQKRRRLLRLSVFLYIISGIVFTIGVIVAMTGSSSASSIFSVLFILILPGAITVSILRSALYNRRIRNRQEAIEVARREGTRPESASPAPTRSSQARSTSATKDIRTKLSAKQVAGLMNGIRERNKEAKEAKVIITRTPRMMEGKTRIQVDKTGPIDEGE